jgi:hypothetical protein
MFFLDRVLGVFGFLGWGLVVFLVWVVFWVGFQRHYKESGCLWSWFFLGFSCKEYLKSSRSILTGLKKEVMRVLCA